MIDWSKQHCGVHRAEAEEVIKYMPDLKELIETFPDKNEDFVWDVKVHMLMPNQFPCIPNWHFDNVPRVNNKQDFDLVDPTAPMYLWVSNAPLTEFRKNGRCFTIKPKQWFKFTQEDEHRGQMSDSFCWRGFVRATHKRILAANPSNVDKVRRHSQVYLDSSNFSW